MNHEETMGTPEAVATDVPAIVQALVSGRNTAEPEVGAAVAGEAMGTVGRAREAARAAVEQAGCEPSVPAPSTRFTTSNAEEGHVVPAAEAVMHASVPAAGPQGRTDTVKTPLADEAHTKTTGAKVIAAKARSKVAAKAKKAPSPAKGAKSKPPRKGTSRPRVAGAGAEVRKAKLGRALPGTKAPRAKLLQEEVKVTVPEVWRSIVKKNERQGSKRYDVLVCQHAVPANDNTYRTARACPECRLSVQQYADEVAAARARNKGPRRHKA